MSKPQGIVRPLGLALVLAIGFATVFGFAVVWGISIWESLRGRDQTRESLAVRWDGTPLVQHYDYHGYQKVTLRALDGSEVPPPKDNPDWLQAARLAVPRGDERIFPLSGNARSSRITRFYDNETPPKFWYFVDDGASDGRGYFVGYDSESTLCVGFIGRNGFRSDRPPVEEWFPMDGVKLASGVAFSHSFGNPYAYYGFGTSDGREEFPTWKVNMLSGNKLLQVDLQTGSVATLMEAADMLAVEGLETAWKLKAGDEEAPRIRHRQYLALRTTERVFVFDATGKQHAAFPLPQELRNQTFAFYELDAKTALVAVSHWLPDLTSREELAWIDASENVLRRAEVTLGKADPHYVENTAWGSAFVVPAPLVLVFLAAAPMPLAYRENGFAPTYSAALAQVLAAWWPALLVITLLAAALAWYCYRHHRRYCQSFGGAWLVFVFLLGLPGLVGYLFHRRWPVLERCPACGHAVPRDRETCAHCGAAFPPPEPKGCEVFA